MTPLDPPPAPSHAEEAFLEASLTSARDSLHTADDIGRALVDYVLSEAAHRGTFSADSGKIEVPLTATLALPQNSPTFDGTTGVAKLCITAFGYEIICMEATISSTST